MKFVVAGGTGKSILDFINDVKLHVAFKHFTGDGIVQTVFPSVAVNDAGFYEAVLDTKGAGGSDVIQSVTVESSKLAYVLLGGLAFIMVLAAWGLARKK